MNPIMNQWVAAAWILGLYALGTFFQNRRIDDLRDSIGHRFEDLRDLLKSEIKGLDERLDRMDQRFDHVDERLERLEHPIIRQS
jgi:hypothetical protein